MPQESGGRATRNQPYSMLSVTGDAVLLEFDSPASSTNTTNAAAAALNAHASSGVLTLGSHSGMMGHGSGVGGSMGEGYGQGINLASSSAGFGHYNATSGSSGSISKMQAQAYQAEHLQSDSDAVA